MYITVLWSVIGGTAPRDFWKTVSWVIILRLGWIQFPPSFLDWLLINFFIDSIWIVSLCFIQGLTEDYNPGDSLRNSSKVGKESIYIHFLGAREYVQSSNYHLGVAGHQEQISQVNDFSAFLVMDNGSIQVQWNFSWDMRLLASGPFIESTSASSWIPLMVRWVCVWLAGAGTSPS